MAEDFGASRCQVTAEDALPRLDAQVREHVRPERGGVS